ncbi:MAG TPA: sigma-70 family RNA polymerase sigma factor, partial [Urbifossiella sp.]|nr:sigma-70 family RNA polymerase sigma factor [Urbifossiella sp.]
MPIGQLSEILHQLRPPGHPGCTELTDDHLLERYVRHHDASALAALVGRHGPMVWGVCRRVLRGHHDAEDAFQATFLVLLRKAATIRPGRPVAGWLYGVARKTARYTRATVARRATRERPAEELPEPEARADERGPGLLDAALGALPDRYRTAIVLCDLEGKTRTEAARECGVPEGTMAGWLTRGRALLARRLARHGIGLSVVASVLSQAAAAGGMPRAVLTAALRMVGEVIAGQQGSRAAPARVVNLMEGVVKTMLLNELKTPGVALGLVLALVLGLGAGLKATGPITDPPAGEKRDPVAEPATKSRPEPAKVHIRDSVAVERLAFNQDGTLVVTSGGHWGPLEAKPDDGVANGAAKVRRMTSAMRVWDARTGELRKTLVGEKNVQIFDGIFSADGTTLAVLLQLGDFYRPAEDDDRDAFSVFTGPGQRRTEIRLYDARTWGVRHRFGCDEAAGSYETLAFSPNGEWLAAGGMSHRTRGGALLKIWNVPGKTLDFSTERLPEGSINELPASPASIRAMAFSADGKTIATGCRDGKARVYDAKTGALRQTLGESEPEFPAFMIAISPDGKRLAVGYAPQSLDEILGGTLPANAPGVRIWSLETGKLHRAFRAEKSWNQP